MPVPPRILGRLGKASGDCEPGPCPKLLFKPSNA